MYRSSAARTNDRLVAIDDVVVEYKKNSMVKTSLAPTTEFTQDGVSGRPEEFKRANSFVSLAVSASPTQSSLLHHCAVSVCECDDAPSKCWWRDADGLAWSCS
jgi:hypothetical protein